MGVCNQYVRWKQQKRQVRKWKERRKGEENEENEEAGGVEETSRTQIVSRVAGTFSFMASVIINL